MNILIITIVFLFNFFITAPTYGESGGRDQNQNIKKMTLADTVVLVLRNNRSLQNSLRDRTVQKFNLRVAEDEFVPDLTIGPSLSQSSNESSGSRTSTSAGAVAFTITQKIPTGGSFRFAWDNSVNRTANDTADTSLGASWNLSFSQPLLRGGGRVVNTASLTTARFSEEQNILSLVNTVMSTVTSTIFAFRSFLLDKKQLDITKNSLKRAKKLLEINKALIQAGRMAQVEIVQTEADIANKEFSLLSGKNNLDSARLSLIKILDIDKHTLINPEEIIDIVPVQPTLEESIATAFKNRPDYQQALISLEITKINLAIAKNNKLWDLSLDSSVGRSGTADNFGSAYDQFSEFGKSDWNVGLNLSIPFGDLTREQSELRAEISLEKEKTNLKELRENIEIEVQDVLRDVEMRLKQVELAKQARILSERKLEIENEKLKAGRTTNFQLVNFQNDLVSSLNNELSSKINYLNALASFDQILGTTLKTWGINISKRNNIEIQ